MAVVDNTAWKGICGQSVDRHLKRASWMSYRRTEEDKRRRY